VTPLILPCTTLAGLTPPSPVGVRCLKPSVTPLWMLDGINCVGTRECNIFFITPGLTGQQVGAGPAGRGSQCWGGDTGGGEAYHATLRGRKGTVCTVSSRNDNIMNKSFLTTPVPSHNTYIHTYIHYTYTHIYTHTHTHTHTHNN
jgi:hypothetical protein